jgi:hypothetical protein
LLLLYFSTIISQLSGENNSLTQRIAILDWRVRQLEEQINEPVRCTNDLFLGSEGKR